MRNICNTTEMVIDTGPVNGRVGTPVSAKYLGFLGLSAIQFRRNTACLRFKDGGEIFGLIWLAYSFIKLV